jgi:glycosyltransferase involved in cell wall biosynthesis
VAQAVSPPAVALLPWGNLIEDFLDSIGVSFERFRDEMTGGWMFGYIDALRLAGVRTVLVCVSARVREVTRCRHAPTGAALCLLPASRSYRLLSRRVGDPYAWMDGEARRRQPLLAALRDVAPYLATPLRLLRRELRREGCAAVLCQEYEYPRFDACVLLGRLMKLPVFATFQGGDWQMSRLERPVRPHALRACAGLIVATGSEADRLRARYGVPPEKVARIFNPLDLSGWGPCDAAGRSATRQALGIPPEARVVVWHGRIDIHRKGLDILLDAWRRLAREDRRLLLVGTGTDSPELHRRLASPDLPGVVWIDEYVLDRAAMRRYLSAADVYTLPSRHEGFPVAPLEAMACGLPVVAADAQGIPDILEGGESAGGLRVPREDPDALALALDRLLGDEAWAGELGRRARRRVESRFSLAVVGAQLRELLVRHGTSPG